MALKSRKKTEFQDLCLVVYIIFFWIRKLAVQPKGSKFVLSFVHFFKSGLLGTERSSVDIALPMKKVRKTWMGLTKKCTQSNRFSNWPWWPSGLDRVPNLSRHSLVDPRPNPTHDTSLYKSPVS